MTSSIGVLRSAQQASLDCSSLTLAVVERDAGPFFSWFNESLKGSATERPGRLEFLGIDGRTLAIADLGNLGILRYAPAPFPATDSGIPRVQVDLYCETLNLSV